MKAALYSINRPHTDNIKSGLKLWEIRKTKPNIPVPFPAFVYETKRNGGCGKVIGEFVCDKIKTITMPANLSREFLDKTCLSANDIMAYLGGDFYKTFYGLHISKLKIYGKPKGISEFRRPCNADINNCRSCINSKLVKADVGIAYLCCRADYLTRPPQSWCYVEAQT